ncbi:hypothetical protein U0030_13165 [Brevundimonas bullata]|uniref:hypothetical protein n=1 Tax=Brevundimonas bullata TaxID=13160 RepID=UPI001FEA48C5|nr:hypothetical protein [Brevundimonas bullata]WQE38618.1 hypothetical protein U0030_13165 [Brevundimonas bullata]
MARAFVGLQVGDLGLDSAKAAVEVESTPNVIRVNIAYDASDHPLMALSGLIPSPPKVIRRTAVVRLGGY